MGICPSRLIAPDPDQNHNPAGLYANVGDNDVPPSEDELSEDDGDSSASDGESVDEDRRLEEHAQAIADEEGGDPADILRELKERLAAVDNGGAHDLDPMDEDDGWDDEGSFNSTVPDEVGCQCSDPDTVRVTLGGRVVTISDV